MDTNNVSLDTTYYWLMPGIHHQVLKIVTNAPFQEYGNYISAKGSAAGLKQVTADNLQFTVYPNPSSGYINIQSTTELN